MKVWASIENYSGQSYGCQSYVCQPDIGISTVHLLPVEDSFVKVFFRDLKRDILSPGDLSNHVGGYDIVPQL